MLLDDLQYFEWLNEPRILNYNESGIEITTESHTDFWSSKHHQIHKDNGHFFFRRQDKNFSLTLHWSFPESGEFRQCGLMLRQDERNWAKVGLMSAKNTQPQLGSIITNGGYSDWATANVPTMNGEIWLRAKRINSDFIFFYSTDGEEFQQLRMFHLRSEFPEIKAGAYACSPQNKPFSGTLRSIEFA